MRERVCVHMSLIIPTSEQWKASEFDNMLCMCCICELPQNISWGDYLGSQTICLCTWIMWALILFTTEPGTWTLSRLNCVHPNCGQLLHGPPPCLPGPLPLFSLASWVQGQRSQEKGRKGFLEGKEIEESILVVSREFLWEGYSLEGAFWDEQSWARRVFRPVV